MITPRSLNRATTLATLCIPLRSNALRFHREAIGRTRVSILSFNGRFSIRWAISGSYARPREMDWMEFSTVGREIESFSASTSDCCSKAVTASNNFFRDSYRDALSQA